MSSDHVTVRRKLPIRIPIRDSLKYNKKTGQYYPTSCVVNTEYVFYWALFFDDLMPMLIMN